MIDEFLENVESTKKLELSLGVLGNDALLKKLKESTINIHTVEIQSTCKVHHVLRKYSLPSCLEVVRINENDLDFEDISALVRSLSSVNYGLHELDLSRSKFRESSTGSFFAFIWRVLINCKDLRILILTNNGLTEHEITCLITTFDSMKNIKILNVSKNNLTETQANDILQKHGQAKSIVSLDLSQNAIQGNRIIIGICQLQSLEELNISRNYIRFFPLPNLEEKCNKFSENTKIISLASNHMTPDDICKFCSLIRSDLLKLDLDFNHVGNSIWSLCSLGLSIKHLKVLSLANTDICGDVVGLANLLSSVGELEELNLSSNNLMANDFRVLQSPLSDLIQLKKLNLSSNPEGISALLQWILPLLKYLEELRLSNTHLNSDDLSNICYSLASLSSLKYLDLSMNAIGSDGLRALANILKEFPLLEGLDISRACIKEDDISILCKGLVPLEKVRYLNMSGNRIDLDVLDDDLFLPPTLEELIFSDIITHGEKLFAKMKQLKNLRKLHLNQLRLRAYSDVEVLAAVLLSFPKLRELSLADITVSDLKCAVRSLGDIKKIDLTGIKLLDERALVDMLSCLLYLEELVLTDMNVANMDCERFFSAVKLLTHLRKLNLGGVKIRDEKAWFDMLSSLLILEEIVFPNVGLMNTDCMTAYFSSLESLRYLKNLDLQCTKIRKPGVEALALVLPSLQLLEKLVLGGINFDDGCQKQLFAALGKLKYLKELDLCYTRITQTGAEALALVLPSLQLLEKLDLGKNDFVDGCKNTLFSALGKLKYLKELNLSCTRITQTAAEALADVLQSLLLLEKLVLGRINFDGGCQKQLFAALGKLKYLKKLDLCYTRITQTGAEALADVLPSLQLLEKLVLGGINFDDGCQKQLFAALGKLKYLKELDLCYTRVTQTGVEALADVLPSLQLLEKLDLGKIDFDDGCQKQLFSALRKLKYLKELDLCYTRITQTGAEALADVLPSLQLLEKLDLGKIDFDDGCQKQLFSALGKLKYLKELHLCYTRITQTGAEALADVLTSLQLLEKLELGEINFGDGCQKQLLAALGKLKYLKGLSLCWTAITQTGAEALAEVLPSLQLLEKLKLHPFKMK
ncbi:NLR family CARD domain-containing 3-like, partial [Paramuricea clavata]